MLARFSRLRFWLAALCLAVVAGAAMGPLSPVVDAQRARTANDAVYTDAEAGMGAD